MQLRQWLALAVIAVLIAVPVYMLFLRPDGSGTSSSDLAKAARDPAEAAKVLSQQAGDPGQGISVRFPPEWSGGEARGVVRLSSGDKTTSIAITSRGGARDAKTVFREAIAGVRSDFKSNATLRYISAKQQAPIAGLPSAAAVVTGALKHGGPRTAQIFVARGKRRSYLITVLGPTGIGVQTGVVYLILGRGLTLTG